MRHPKMSVTLSPILVDAIELRKLALRIRECYGYGILLCIICKMVYILY